MRSLFEALVAALLSSVLVPSLSSSRPMTAPTTGKGGGPTWLESGALRRHFLHTGASGGGGLRLAALWGFPVLAARHVSDEWHSEDDLVARLREATLVPLAPPPERAWRIGPARTAGGAAKAFRRGIAFRRSLPARAAAVS